MTSIFRNFRTPSLLFFLVPLSPTLAYGQTIPYKNIDELIGAGSAFSIANPLIIQRITSFCALQCPQLRPEADKAQEMWIGRHKTYLKLSDNVRFYMILRAKKVNPPTKTSIDIINFDNLTTNSTNTAMDEFLAPLQKMANRKQPLEPTCKALIKAINEGEFDLSKRQPQLIHFFDTIKDSEPK